MTYGDLGQSSWFTRGWTLQELLAPQSVLPLNKSWKLCGYKGMLRPDQNVLFGAHPLYVTRGCEFAKREGGIFKREGGYFEQEAASLDIATKAPVSSEVPARHYLIQDCASLDRPVAEITGIPKKC